jgi:hypothetical protein
LLWEYAQRRRVVDADFADDLEWALKGAGYDGGAVVWTRPDHGWGWEATLPDPDDPTRYRLVLHTFEATTDAGWSVWGNQRGIHVRGVVANLDAAQARAELVYRAIIGTL